MITMSSLLAFEKRSACAVVRTLAACRETRAIRSFREALIPGSPTLHIHRRSNRGQLERDIALEDQPEVVVAGLGVMGAAVTWELARRGVSVLGIDARDPLHSLGSSHGITRIIREAYYEDPLYVPLVHRAWDRWAALEQETGATLLQRTGCLNMGPAGSGFLEGVMRSVREHGLAHESLDATAIAARFPALTPDPHFTGVFEPRASVLFAERCVAALHGAARARHASLHFGEALRSWRTDGDGVCIETSRATVRAQLLVLALGAWLPRVASFPLTIERQCVVWFQPLRRREAFAPGRLPITLWEHAPGRLAYAFPDLGDGVKASLHHQGIPCDPDAMDREVGEDDEARVRLLLQRCMPDAAGPRLEATVCTYTNTPDFNFLIDRHPADDRVFVASACSGHGFKFAPAVAEIVADMCAGLRPAFDTSPFGAARFRG
jgi:sarcosine oxidase